MNSLFYHLSIKNPTPPLNSMQNFKTRYLPLFMENGIEHETNHCVNDTTDI